MTGEMLCALVDDVVPRWLAVLDRHWTSRPGVVIVEFRIRWWWRLLGRSGWALRKVASRLRPVLAREGPCGIHILIHSTDCPSNGWLQ